MRSALLAIAAAIVAVTLVALVERQRLAALDGELAVLADRIAVAERDDARSDALQHDVVRLRELCATLDNVRRDTTIATNTIVRIGNRLPPQTWLTSVQTDRAGSWTIGGRSARLDEIGTTLATVAQLEPAATTRLVSVNAAGIRGALLDFSIALEQPR
jgi:Tfp pilus assembly protein PilN